ncbi:hypothetical protein BH11ACT8_BH11ACT8_09150 [soil metagenome]
MHFDSHRIRLFLVLVVSLVVVGCLAEAGIGRPSPAEAERSGADLTAAAPTSAATKGAGREPGRGTGRPPATKPATPGTQGRGGGDTGQPLPGAGDQRPNIILVSTDDETASDMRWMPKTVQYLAKQGVTFSRALSPHPLCCPARAAILTGQYAQNNGVKSNQDPFNFVALHNKTTLPVWLHRAGYRTAFTGKYLNGYGTKGKPQPGWDYWDATMVNPYSYVGYQMYQNGNEQYYRSLNNVDYINKRMISLVEDFSRGPKPFFIWASHVAPHGRLDKIKNIPSTAEALPPTRFAHLFSDVDSPSLQDPGYSETDVSDKNSLVQSKNQPTKAKINTVFRSRIRALQGVDEGIVDLVQTLRRLGELDNTYIFFTSDNGFLLGEHHLITKNVPYRQSLRVPMIVRGPGVPKGVVRNQRALMIDLAPTFAKIAGATPLVTVDGVSLLPALTADKPLRETVLIQAGPQTADDLPYGWWWRGVTTDRYTYARFFANGIEELYDHKYDPSEIDNVASDPAYADVLLELRQRTQVLVTCRSGAECSQGFGPMPEPTEEPLAPTG